MREKMKGLADRISAAADDAAKTIAAKAHEAADLNGDGVVDEEDARIAAERAKGIASSALTEAVRMTKSAAQTDMAKKTAAGTAIGAAIAVPVPLVGPLAGAVIGGGIAAFKNLTSPTSISASEPSSSLRIDVHGELLKLEDLRSRGILTESEFADQKRHLLGKGYT